VTKQRLIVRARSGCGATMTDTRSAWLSSVTKIHAIVDAKGMLIRLALSPGQAPA
jgi:hypothetical protein